MTNIKRKTEPKFHFKASLISCLISWKKSIHPAIDSGTCFCQFPFSHSLSVLQVCTTCKLSAALAAHSSAGSFQEPNKAVTLRHTSPSCFPHHKCDQQSKNSCFRAVCVCIHKPQISTTSNDSKMHSKNRSQGKTAKRKLAQLFWTHLHIHISQGPSFPLFHWQFSTPSPLSDKFPIMAKHNWILCPLSHHHLISMHNYYGHILFPLVSKTGRIWNNFGNSKTSPPPKVPNVSFQSSRSFSNTL